MRKNFIMTHDPHCELLRITAGHCRCRERELEKMMAEPVALLPCPFCGDSLIADEKINQTRHPQNGCVAQNISFCSERHDVRAQWNRRATPQNARGQMSAAPCLGYPDCDGDLPGEPHEPQCSAAPAMPNPTGTDLVDPVFNAVWNATKTWDLNVPEYYGGYCGMNGSHVMLILNAIRAIAKVIKANIVCQAEGERCHGCGHYKGLLPVCEFAPSAAPSGSDAPTPALSFPMHKINPPKSLLRAPTKPPCKDLREWVNKLREQYGRRQMAAFRDDEHTFITANHCLGILASEHWHEILEALRRTAEGIGGHHE